MAKKKPAKKLTVKSKKTSTEIKPNIEKKVDAKVTEKVEFSANDKIIKVDYWAMLTGDTDLMRRTRAVILSLVTIGLVLGFSFYYFPNYILSQTDTEVAKAQAKSAETASAEAKAEKERQLNVENGILKFEENKRWTTEIEFENVGTISVNLEEGFAPKSVENFIRLAYRDYYDDTSVFRLVKSENFSVIQAGDKENNDGTGGRSAFYIGTNDGPIDEALIPDELWLVEPEFATSGENNVLSNQPQLRAASLYGELNVDQGTILIPKGRIAMAKTDRPDSASSQFFITLTDTILPASYTVFGTIDPAGFSILDKIYNDYNPVATEVETAELTEGSPADGRPDKDLRIKEVKITQPAI